MTVIDFSLFEKGDTYLILAMAAVVATCMSFVLCRCARSAAKSVCGCCHVCDEPCGCTEVSHLAPVRRSHGRRSASSDPTPPPADIERAPPRIVRCDRCDGIGWKSCLRCVGHDGQCTTCEGMGRLWSGNADSPLRICERCDGKGETGCRDVACHNGRTTCASCNGTGRRDHTQPIGTGIDERSESQLVF